jgi:mannose-1-phosphate guanylyltransferase/mannose-6-phosphate isomerase
MTIITPVILCGGSGTRLWPRSRKDRPKPFIGLIGEQSLFEQTLERCDDLARFADPVIVAGRAHVALIADQRPKTRGCSIIVEPAARNTAPAIALAAARLDRDAIMLVCPSDHHIADTEAFQRAAQSAADLAHDDWLVSFGIAATSPETGYGYIKRGDAMGSGFKVDQFVEKPDLEKARQFLADGNYDWNGGIFALKAGSFLDELARYRPQMLAQVMAAVEKGREDGACFHPDAGSFEDIAGESIDYAVMENTARAAIIPVSMGWSDIGNWRAVHDALDSDGAGNAASDKHQLVDCKNTLVVSDGKRVSAIGLDGICIVVDGDEVLVMSADHAQAVGQLDGATKQ